MNRGKVVILLMFVIAISLTGFAWWFHYQQSRRVVENWGSDTAGLIRRAERVSLLRLSPNAQSDEYVTIAEQRYGVTETKDISKAAGLIHVRHFLVEDTYYDWDERTDGCQPDWSYALRFASTNAEQTLVFDRRCHLVTLMPGEHTLRLGTVINRLEEFVDAL